MPRAARAPQDCFTEVSGARQPCKIQFGLRQQSASARLEQPRAPCAPREHPPPPPGTHWLGLRRRGWGRLLGARSKTGAKHRKRVPPTETHKRGIGPAQKAHRKGHRKMASIDHIVSLSLPAPQRAPPSTCPGMGRYAHPLANRLQTGAGFLHMPIFTVCPDLCADSDRRSSANHRAADRPSGTPAALPATR
jgi:hypothetical protein